MDQPSINQRIKFLLDSSGLSVRAFSEMIGQKAANTQNYVGSRASMPGADYLQSIIEHIENIDPIWLLTGTGGPFLNPDIQPSSTHLNAKKISRVQVVGTNKGKAIQQIEAIGDDWKQYFQQQLDAANEKIALLTSQLADKERIIEAKDETINLLRGSYNRPN